MYLLVFSQNISSLLSAAIGNKDIIFQIHQHKFKVQDLLIDISAASFHASEYHHQ